MTSLYMTNTILANLIDQAIANGGEMPDEEQANWSNWLQRIEEDEPAFLLEMVNAVEQLSMEATASRATAEQWMKRASSRENLMGRLKSEMLRYLELCGKKSAALEDGRKVCSQTNGGQIPIEWAELVDPATIPERFRRVRVELDQSAVRAALEAGEELPQFGRIVPRGKHIRVR